MRKVLIVILAMLTLSVTAAAGQKKHTIKASARPYKALGHSVKAVAQGTVKAAVTVGTFSFEAFDSAVIDPFGVALQAFADDVDMFVAQPLEALPKPLDYIGVGVHYVYLGVDKAGQVLAK